MSMSWKMSPLSISKGPSLNMTVAFPFPKFTPRTMPGSHLRGSVNSTLTTSFWCRSSTQMSRLQLALDRLELPFCSPLSESGLGFLNMGQWNPSPISSSSPPIIPFHFLASSVRCPSVGLSLVSLGSSSGLCLRRPTGGSRGSPASSAARCRSRRSWRRKTFVIRHSANRMSSFNSGFLTSHLWNSSNSSRALRALNLPAISWYRILNQSSCSTVKSLGTRTG
mmetsp:Transcript_78017/g.137625  ORF Transcript_78017/g.137625 Transcript_78017/m.137625 type:complete len:223 (+) Transcript_78017:434-1102(+)